MKRLCSAFLVMVLVCAAAACKTASEEQAPDKTVAIRVQAGPRREAGVRRQVECRELRLHAGFDIDRDQPLNGVLRCRVPVKIERNERQRCLIKNAGSWRLWSRSEPEKRRNHSGATTPAMILSHY